ncbi:MAG: sugar ABC transporter ATP-binding protein [bacterium]
MSATAGAPRLELVGVTKDFGGVRALDGVSFELRAGEVHALCGENGAGKSTLLKVLSGFHPAGSWTGTLRVDGTDVRLHGIRDAERHGIALIAQELALVPALSVEANLVLGREPVRGGLIQPAVVRARAIDALARVGLQVDPARALGELGVGQRQLVEIARALAQDARILVLDEPTASLPESDAQRLLALLGELRARGTAILYVSHRLDEVARLADRITVLRDGRTVASAPAADLPRDRLIAHMVGRDLAEQRPRTARTPGPRALTVRDWTLADPGRPWRNAVEGVSFTLHVGEVLGVGGLIGAGRTALLASLFGAARSRVTGTLRVADAPERAPFRAPAEAVAAGLALVSEDRRRQGLVPDASVLDNLSLATLTRFTHRGLLDDRARATACAEQAEALHLRPADLSPPVVRLSGGNQQKVVLGRWWLAGPRVLLLDEPTRGIDVGARAVIHDWLDRLCAHGLAVLLVSSDLPELLALSDRVLVLAQGRPTALLDRATATPEAVLAAATHIPIAEVPA